MKFALFVVFTLMTTVSYADTFPNKCKVLPIKGDSVKVEAAPTSIILLSNLSDQDLWVTHPMSDPSANAGWSSRLESKKWSALALGDKKFELNCIESKPGHEQQVPCSLVLAVCEWANIPNTDKELRPFWAGENMPLSELRSHLLQRGFKLPSTLKKG